MEDPNTLPWTSDRQWTLPYLSFRVQSWCQSWKFGFGMYSTAMLTFSQRLWCQRLLLNVIQEQFTETLSTSSTFICLLFCRRRNLVIAAFSMIWHFPCILKKRIEFQLWQNFLTAKKNLFNVKSKTLSTSSTFVCLLFWVDGATLLLRLSHWFDTFHAFLRGAWNISIEETFWRPRITGLMWNLKATCERISCRYVKDIWW